jgi:hypothetical protein
MGRQLGGAGATAGERGREWPEGWFLPAAVGL